MWFRVGIVAIVASFAVWVVIALAPLVGPVVGLSLGEAGGAIGVLLVIAEVLFWAGLALAGKDTWRTVKVHGWRRAPGELTKLLVHGRPEQASERPGDQPAEAEPLVSRS